jgi:hypothetical protein
MVVDRLTGLGQIVLESAVRWVMTRIVAIVGTRLAALAASAGWSLVIEAVVAIYQAIRTAMEYAQRILQILLTAFNTVAQIAQGVIGPAATMIENGLRMILPIVIGFLANYAGLGGISNRIRDIIGGIRERVDAAILWLINRGMATLQGLLNMIRSDGAEVVEGKPGEDGSTQPVMKEFSMMGMSHHLIIDMKEAGLDTQMASTAGTLIQKVSDEVATQNNIINILSSNPPADPELISYHKRAKDSLQGILTWYESERKRINNLRASAGNAKVQDMLRDFSEQLAQRIIRVAAVFRLDDFVRKTFNVAEHLEAIVRQVEQIEKHVNNPNAKGDGMAYTAAAAEMYLGWLEPGRQRHVDKVSIAIRVIDGALKELNRLTEYGVDMRGEQSYVRGKTVFDMCLRAISTPKQFLFARGHVVLKSFIDDMDSRGQKGNGSALSEVKLWLGMK